MNKASEHRQHADECRSLAKQMETREDRDQLLRLAEAWDRLAVEVEPSGAPPRPSLRLRPCLDHDQDLTTQVEKLTAAGCSIVREEKKSGATRRDAPLWSPYVQCAALWQCRASATRCLSLRRRKSPSGARHDAPDVLGAAGGYDGAEMDTPQKEALRAVSEGDLRRRAPPRGVRGVGAKGTTKQSPLCVRSTRADVMQRTFGRSLKKPAVHAPEPSGRGAGGYEL